MTNMFERRSFQFMMSSGERARSPFSMHPTYLIIIHLFLGNVVADEVNQFSIMTWQNFLKCLKDKSINQEMVDRGEIRS